MLKLLLVDDHHLFRRGLTLMLAELGMAVDCVEAASCEEALALPDAGGIALVLLDLHLPGTSGMEALPALKRHFEAAAIVVLSGEEHPATIRRAIDAGAAGYIPKTSSPKVMLAALRLVVAGGTYLPPSMLTIDDVTPAASNPSAFAAAPRESMRSVPAINLTDRQVETLQLAIQGKPNKVIAREMQISEATVKAHLATAFRVLGVRNRTEAVFAAARRGLPLPFAAPGAR